MSASRENRTLDGGAPSTRGIRPLPGGGDRFDDPDPSHPARKIRSLIVDDQAIGREAMRRMLKQLPEVEVVGIAADAKHALDLVRKVEPDVLFLDIQMPGMDGLQLASAVEGIHGPAIVFVTASEDFAVRAFEVGATDYLVKPCTHDRLKRTLQRVRSQLR